MFKKNNFFFGFSLALLITAAVFGFLYLVNTILLNAMFGKPLLSESLLLITGLGINIFALNYYTTRGAYKTARGMMAFVFVCAAYIIYTYFGVELGFRKAEV